MSPPRFEQFFAVRRFPLLSSLTFSPDSEHVAYVHDGSGQMNLWRQPATGGAPAQLTALVEDSARQHEWTPHGFILGIDHHGDEQWQLHRVPATGGTAENLTRRDHVQCLAGQLHPDGERITFSGNLARPGDQGVHLLHIPDGETRPLVEDEGNYRPGPWHPDGRRLAVTQVHANSDQDVFLLDVHSGERTPLTAHEGEEVNQPVGFSADGRSLLLLTDRGHEFRWLARRSLNGDGELEPVWRGDWDVEHAATDRGGRRLAWVVNEDGASTFHARDLETGRDLPVPELPRGWCLNFALSPDGRRLAACVGAAIRPFDVYVADLETGVATRLTESFHGGVPETDLVAPELVRYPSFDGRRVPAWLYRPPGGGGRFPVVLCIHGGPEAQERPGSPAQFSFYQYLLSRGIGVLAPNIRGSTGYGKTYQSLIRRDWGGAELKDIDAAARYLHGLDWVDSERVAVFGGSFGGFATLSAMTRLPQHWACGVDLVGPANLVTFARAVPPFWRHMMKSWVGDPDEDRDLLVERSPITYVENVRAPLLVLQGAHDPRVVRPESDQVVERLRSLGREVEYHVFEDEGHGFAKQANQVRAYRLIADFLERHLGARS
ncbi:MAG TPA: S9 family peptidase [Candidatus Dormibacteraeota bacterium]